MRGSTLLARHVLPGGASEWTHERTNTRDPGPTRPSKPTSAVRRLSLRRAPRSCPRTMMATLSFAAEGDCIANFANFAPCWRLGALEFKGLIYKQVRSRSK